LFGEGSSIAAEITRHLHRIGTLPFLALMIQTRRRRDEILISSIFHYMVHTACAESYQQSGMGDVEDYLQGTHQKESTIHFILDKSRFKMTATLQLLQ